MLSLRDATTLLLALTLTLSSACSDDAASTKGGPEDSDNPALPGSPAGPKDPGKPQDPTQKNQPESFESDFPSAGENARGYADAGSAAVPLLPGAQSSGAEAASDASRAIVEADIIQVAGQRLYALSRIAGLTVIDLTDAAQLKILGRYRELNGQPFEMYLRGDVVLAMYSGWGQYTRRTDGGYSYILTSKVVALDVANPATIGTLGSFDVAGDVSDSRIVGDVMYVVGYQSGSCWGCTNNKPLTSILSLDVKDPRQVKKVDELQFADANNTYGWSKRSVTVTDKRMFVAGPEYGQNAPTGSTVQVVDISSPTGDLVEGASIQVAGQVASRWQMDEYQGVLRVVSQTPSWTVGSVPPQVQTYRIDSSQSLTPLGSTALIIPPNETLNTVRFDGARGYAITSERTDPLFTIDLSNPALPRQVGELHMPGWIYHLEPRGNRLIGLGYDRGNPSGSITVSVFDVSTLATPKLLDRVNFGGSWASLPEDQDRIHKAFKILPEHGLILVPFSGYSDNLVGKAYCYGNYRSGVQLVDYVGDDLTLRGNAPSRGEARRAIVHAQKLLTVSDEAVDAYDIRDRSAPAPLQRLSIARNVTRALPLENGSVARINQDYYGSQSSIIDFAPLADVDKPDVSVGELNLSQLLSGDVACSNYAYIENAFVRGNRLNLAYQRWASDAAGTRALGVLTVDASDPSKPVVLSKLESTTTNFDTRTWHPFASYYHYGYDAAQESVVRTDNALVFEEQRYNYSATGRSRNEGRLRIVDLTDPLKPVESILPLPGADGYSGLVVDGGNVMLSHYEITTSGRVRFYLDRVDLSVVGKPVIASKVNVPGSLLHYDRETGRMLNSELVRTVVPQTTATDCYARFAFADFSPKDVGVSGGTGTCTGYMQTLHLVRFVPGGAVRDDSLQLGERERFSASSLASGRVTAVLSKGYRSWHSYAVPACFDCGGFGHVGNSSEPVEVLTLGGFDSGSFVSGRLSVIDQQQPWWGFWGSPPVYSTGTRALVRSHTEAVVIDVANPAAPSIVRTTPLYGYAQDLQGRDNLVLMALGYNGVQRIDL